MANSYMTRAMRSADPRYRRILTRLGYGKPVKRPERDEMTELRQEYERVVGKRPFHGWDASKLREKMAEVISKDSE